jgi:hypothetical protein
MNSIFLQEFPKSFVDNLKKYNIHELRLFGPLFRVGICKVRSLSDNPNELLLGEDWISFFRKNEIIAGDTLRFAPKGLQKSSLIIVEKLVTDIEMFAGSSQSV